MPSNVDVVVVHAGATHVLDAWLDALADGGRLLVPLTVQFAGMPAGIGKGMVVLVTRESDAWTARVVPVLPVAIYSLKDLRDESTGIEFGEAMMTGAVKKIRRVRRDTHERVQSCVVHGPSNCLSE